MDKILMEHGSGGRATDALIHDIFSKYFHNEVLSRMEDSAVVDVPTSRIAMTTDSFVVTPLEFPGGDIGRLCVCGTVNDLLMRGATPKYLTCGFILQEGLEIETLERIVKSMAETAKEAGVIVVAGDTKVVEGNGGLVINTAGVGLLGEDVDISAYNAKTGDVILVSGNVGDHHAAILSARMNIKNTIESDNAPLGDIVNNLLEADIPVHVLRDVTRGGLATILKELAGTSGKVFELAEELIPVSSQVKDFAGLLGLDPLYMGNEGKCIVIVPEAYEDKALEVMHQSAYGQGACRIGMVLEPEGEDAGSLYLRTRIGGRRVLTVLQGEGLPRIC